MEKGNSPLEKVAREAISRSQQGPVSFAVLEGLAKQHNIPFQRLLSFLDVAGGCEINHNARQVDCSKE